MEKGLTTIMPLLINNMTRDGTSRDFEAMLDDFRTAFKIILPEYVSVDYEDDYGIAIAEVILWIIDNLNYQLDFYVQQRTRKYCRSRQSLQDIMEWYNWYIPSKSSAKSEKQKMFITSFPVGHNDGISIPEGTSISTVIEVEDDIVYFETDEELILEKEFLAINADGSDTVNIGAGNTENFQIDMMCEIKNDSGSEMTATLLSKDDTLGNLTFDVNIPVDYTVATNSYVAMLEAYCECTEGRSYTDVGVVAEEVPFEQFQTSRTNVIDDTLTMEVDAVPYSKVDTLLYSEPDDLVYELRKTIDNKNIAVTGDGFTGKIPSGTVVLSYKCGGGRRGNLGKGLITEVKDSILYHGSVVNVQTTNDENSKYGGEEMTLYRAKIVGPSTIFALDRAVTAEDFEALLESYPNVSRVTASKTHDNVAIYLLGDGVTSLSRSVKNDILEYLKVRKIGGDAIISLYDPTFVVIDMIIKIKMKRDFSKSFSKAADMIYDDLEKYFDPGENSRLVFGKTKDERGNLFSSDIYNIADDDEKDVEYALIPMFTIRPRISYNEYWPTDSEILDVTISETYTNSETWTISCIIDTSKVATYFKVKGSNSGVQSNLAKAGEVYHTDDGKVSFLIEESTILFKRNLAVATLVVIPVKNEYIPINDGEFPTKGSILIEEIL